MKTSTKNHRAPFFGTVKCVVLLALFFAGLTTFAAEQITQVGALAVPRKDHTATVLADGKVLILGGQTAAGEVASAELYDPVTRTFSSVGSMSAPRVRHAATLLPGGKVLITGGRNGLGALATAEIFDPAATVRFRTLPGLMRAARQNHTSTLLSTGKVLVAGGDLSGTAELYDPATETFSSSLIAMIASRSGQTATTLPENSVLLAGGGTRSVEVFDVQTTSFLTWTAALTESRTLHSAIKAVDGSIYFVGGEPSGTLEKFNLLSGSGASFPLGASSSAATQLANGKILVTGQALASLFSPSTGTLAPIANAGLLQRTGQTVTELPGDKQILVAGGVNAASGYVTPAALYNPARIETDKQDYQPDDLVIVNGFGWKPGEPVDLYVVDNLGWVYDSTATADANGQFVADPYFVVLMRHLGVTFDLKALGVQSGLRASHTFTDNTNGVRKIGFSNSGPASFAVGVAGGPMTLQTQDGSSPAIPEPLNGNVPNSTITVLLTSNSATGSFATSLAGPYTSTISQSINSGSATNPNFPDFYYRDSTAGSVTITATVTALGSGFNAGAFPVGSTATLNKTVGKANTTTALARTVGSASSTYGDSLTFQATVSNVTAGGTGTPTGTVDFKDGATVIGSGALNGSGVATLATSTIAVGARSITAVYNADSNFNGSTSGVVSQTVAAKDLTMTNAVANSKVYDGNNSATVNFTGATLVGVVSPDVVTINSGSYTATFNNKNVGNGKSVTVTGVILGGAGASNYTVSQPTGLTANISALAIAGSITASNKVYDATTAATIATRTLSGVLGTDDVSYVGGSATFADKNVGTGKTVTATGLSLSGTDAGNYTVNTTATATADITALAITGSFTANDKTYDGNNNATIATRTLSGVLGTDVVSYTGGTATFDNKNVGTSKTVTATGLSLSGGDAGNYTVNASATTTASITPRALVVSAAGQNKPYDGTNTATVTLSHNGVAGDALTLAYGTATFNNENVGTSKPINVTGISVTGADAGNYTFNMTASTTADITAIVLTITATGTNKVYDGTTAATVSLSTNKLAGDDVTASYGSAVFVDKNVGTNKAVGVSGITLSGADAGNYTFSDTASTTANITAKSITGSITAANRVYNANTNAMILTRTLAGTIANDDVTYTGGSASFANKNVGAAKLVTATGLSLTGVDAGNYAVNSTATTTADITTLAIAGSITASNKVYDATTAATIATRTLSGVLGTDDVSYVGGSATFADKNVGTGKTVTATGLSLSGTDAGNYTVNTTATATADITALAITGSFTADNKVYDGNTTAAVLTRTPNGVLGTDTVTLEGGTATFDTKDVGTGKTVTLAGATFGGAQAGNYSLTSVGTTTANITALAITGNFTAGHKVYDGNTSAAVLTRTLNGVLSGDVVSLTGGTAMFADANIGTAKTVTLVGAALNGAQAGNYSLTSVGTTTANITALPVTGSFTADDKVYDGTTAATVLTRTMSGVLAADLANVSLTGGTATFANANVGIDKTVTLAGATLSGTAAANYDLTSVGTTLADITPLGITGSFTASGKIYNANTAATVVSRTLHGVLLGDVVTLNGGTATFDTKDVGTGKTVTLTGATLDGAQAGNYSLTGVGTTTANITPLGITGSFTADHKVYDATTAATVLTRTPNGILGSDVVTLVGGTATFDTKDAGTGKTVTLSGATLSGAQAGNYSLTSVNPATANITPLGITGSFTADNKVYNGNTTAAVLTRTPNGVLGTDTVTLEDGTATFDTKDVGTGKTVTLAGATLGGAQAGNYSLTSVGTTTANITALAITGNFTAGNKVYDGNTSAAVLTRTLNGVLSGDVVSLTGGTAMFADANIGTAKTVTLIGATLNGAQAGNYSLTSVGTTTANITALPITGSFTADDKVYDATTTATVLNRTLSGVLAADLANVSLTGGTATFANANVGIDKTVTLAGATLSGTAAANYDLTSVGTTLADITPLGITGSFTASGKIYNANIAATVVSRTLNGVLGTDLVTLEGGTATFATKDVGIGKTVTLAGATLGGAQAGNYSLTWVGTTTANITPLGITGSFTADNKVYDANTAATVLTRTPNGILGSDVVSLVGGTATFDTKDAGTGKTVTLSGATLSGAQAGNYSLTSVNPATANITPLGITGSFTADNKIYDGNTSAAVLTRTPNGVLGTDTVTLAGGTATFDTKDVGTGKTVTLAGATLGGAQAGNYSLTSVGTTTANITALAITGNFTAGNKVYDGNTSAAVLTRTLNGVLSGDVVSLTGGTAMFADANIGTAKTVTLVGAALNGAQAGNYSLTSVGTTTANITALHITGSFTASGKVYDGNTSATVLTRSTVGDVGGVILTGGTATFADKNVATGKVVTLAGASLVGADAANYVLDSVATTTADITARHITGAFTAQNKIYDATTAATVLTRSTLGDVGGVILDGGAATFATKTVANGKVVTLVGATLAGTDKANYVLDSVATAIADITPRALVVTALGINKQYDGNTGATVSLSDNRVSGDSLLTAYTSAAFSDKYAGVGKTVTVNGITISGADAANYLSNTATTTTATITPAPLGVIINSPVSGLVWPVNLNVVPNFAGTFTITGNSGSYSVKWTFKSGALAPIYVTQSVTPSVNTGAQNFSTPVVSFAQAGVYAITLEVTDGSGAIVASTTEVGTGNVSAPAYIVIYDPSAGFVTGGGWIDSPAGAYAADPGLTGKANFGFVSQYKKGATVPTGNTEFQFKAGDLNFHSTEYQWLVVAGARAQYKGKGTINGTGTFGFILTAIDGSVNGGGGTDKFRVKIWVYGNETQIVYDNQMTAGDDANLTTGLGGGSIVIHDPGKK